jgi:hypothetical protein
MRGKDFGLLILTVELNPGSQGEQGRGVENGVVSKHLTFELVGSATPPLESFRDLVKSPRLPSIEPVPQRAQDSGRL